MPPFAWQFELPTMHTSNERLFGMRIDSPPVVVPSDLPWKGFHRCCKESADDLILPKPGLSPSYGAVIESLRIVVHIIPYVVYGIAASLILVLALSIISFATGCAADSILVIILVLFNDISTGEPAQLPAKPSFIWLHFLLFMEEFTIFSARAPSLFWVSMSGLVFLIL